MAGQKSVITLADGVESMTQYGVADSGLLAMTEENPRNAVAGWREVEASDCAEAGGPPFAALAGAPARRCFRHEDGSAAAIVRIADLKGQAARTTLALTGEKDPKAGLLSVSAGVGPDRIAGAIDCCTGDEELGRYPLYLALPDTEKQPMTAAVRARLVVPEPVGTLDVRTADGECRWNLYRVKMDERLSPDLRRELLSRGVGPGPIEGPDNLRGREKWFQRRSGEDE